MTSPVTTQRVQAEHESSRSPQTPGRGQSGLPKIVQQTMTKKKRPTGTNVPTIAPNQGRPKGVHIPAPKSGKLSNLNGGSARNAASPIAIRAIDINAARTENLGMPRILTAAEAGGEQAAADSSDMSH